MWIFLAFASAFFAGITGVLAKIGIKDIDSHLATALRTIVVLFFSCLMVFVVNSQGTLFYIDSKTLLFLFLSGCATGASWLCYFKALKIGDINKVTPIDKSSTVLTIILSIIFLGESFKLLTLFCVIAIALGTYMMIDIKKGSIFKEKPGEWLIYALLSAIFASLTAILGKIGIENVESNLGTAIRTFVVLIIAWGIVFKQGSYKNIGAITKKSWLFLTLSGLSTGLSWLCFYRALQQGYASIVVPIDKLSILVTVFFGYFIFNEKLSRKNLFGLSLIVLGTLGLLL